MYSLSAESSHSVLLCITIQLGLCAWVGHLFVGEKIVFTSRLCLINQWKICYCCPLFLIGRSRTLIRPLPNLATAINCERKVYKLDQEFNCVQKTTSPSSFSSEARRSVKLWNWILADFTAERLSSNWRALETGMVGDFEPRHFRICKSLSYQHHKARSSLRARSQEHHLKL